MNAAGDPPDDPQPTPGTAEPGPDAAQAARQAARRQAWRTITQQPPLMAALEESFRDHREAFTDDGPRGIVDLYLQGGRAWWEYTAAAIIALVVALTVFGLVSGILVALLGGTASLGKDAVDGLSGLGIPQTIHDPLTAYLRTHSQGLPISADELAGLWLVTQAVLLAWAMFGSWGARVGWTLMGALTVAAVWAGTTPTSSRWTAAGVAVAAWSLLSIVAFRGAFRRPRVIVVPIRNNDNEP